MKYVRFTAMMLIAATLVFTACDDDGGNNNGGDDSDGYAIGDIGPSGVGIVFYVTDGGLHGLEVAPVDQSTSAAWSNITNEYVNGISKLPAGIGNGSANTDAIIAQANHTASAAKLCREYRSDMEGDWFLPSQEELVAIWDNLVNDGSGNNSGVGGFAGVLYWSSSEEWITSALLWHFLNGGQWQGNKDVAARVRAVRSF